MRGKGIQLRINLYWWGRRLSGRVARELRVECERQHKFGEPLGISSIKMLRSKILAGWLWSAGERRVKAGFR